MNWRRVDWTRMELIIFLEPLSTICGRCRLSGMITITRIVKARIVATPRMRMRLMKKARRCSRVKQKFKFYRNIIYFEIENNDILQYIANKTCQQLSSLQQVQEFIKLCSNLCNTGQVKRHKNI